MLYLWSASRRGDKLAPPPLWRWVSVHWCRSRPSAGRPANTTYTLPDIPPPFLAVSGFMTEQCHMRGCILYMQRSRRCCAHTLPFSSSSLITLQNPQASHENASANAYVGLFRPEEYVQESALVVRLYGATETGCNMRPCTHTQPAVRARSIATAIIWPSTACSLSSCRASLVPSRTPSAPRAYGAPLHAAPLPLLSCARRRSACAAASACVAAGAGLSPARFV